MVYNKVWRRLADAVYAPHCLLCGARGDCARDICADCASELPASDCFCDLCAAPLPGDGMPGEHRICGRCLRRRPAFRHARCAFVYAPPLDHLVHRFKFGGRLEYGRLLGQMFAERLPRSLLRRTDCLVPVPLHSGRLRERGFNQSLLLARSLSRTTRIPVARDLVVRTRATPVQTELNAGQRRRNVRAAFTVQGPVHRRHIALVDDVLTTGATVEEISRVLLRAGAAEVVVCALARAQTPNR